MIRPKLAGNLYEKEYVALMEQIKSCYEHELGPGDLPTRRKENVLKGIVVPHGDYNIVGPCAAWAYKMIAEHSFPETFIILLPEEDSGVMNYQTTLEDFETVFGVCKNDKEVSQKLIDSGIVSNSEKFFSKALELQLPWLQHACKDRIKDVQVVPVIVPHSHNFEALAELISDLDNVVVIAVSNFTRYGPKFLYTPFKYNVESSLNNLDMNLVKFMLSLQSEPLLKFVRKQKLQVTGSNALALALHAFKMSGVDEGELLSYYKSSKIDGDQENSSSFMSFVF
tara:strand:+ start:215 stop:1060 length:846 start_codon:yes stop_codon:yes gene_type:complete